ncbi:hypothetical protein [Nocardioides sp. B-3]|uniref:hypothetical protein n=1 Tax=Nocardioides sp. B-3 TaxID=2895565 RepID=UPI003FA5F40B
MPGRVPPLHRAAAPCRGARALRRTPRRGAAGGLSSRAEPDPGRPQGRRHPRGGRGRGADLPARRGPPARHSTRRRAGRGRVRGRRYVARL